MSLSFPKLSRPTPRVWALMTVVAVIAIALGAWREYYSPRRVWRRAIVNPDGIRNRRTPWAQLWETGRIAGLDRRQTLDEVDRVLGDPDETLRASAVGSIPHLVVRRHIAIGRVLEFINDPHFTVRLAALRTLSYFEKDSGPASVYMAAALLSRLDDENAEVREYGVQLLGRLIASRDGMIDQNLSGPHREKILQTLTTRLQDPEEAVRIETAIVLADNGRGEEAIPMLIEVGRKISDWKLEGFRVVPAADALSKFSSRSDEAALFLFSEMARQGNGYPEGPRSGLVSAARQGRPARLRIERLAMDALRSPDAHIRANAALLLHEIDSGRDFVSQLIEAARTESPAPRLLAIAALGEAGPVDPGVIPALRAAMTDPNPEVNRKAKEALDAIGNQEGR